MTSRDIERLVVENEGLIPFFVMQMFGVFPVGDYSKEELMQIGRVGLLEAALRWDGQRNFSVYAYYWLRQEILSDFQVRQNGLNIPCRVQLRMVRLRKYCAAKNVSFVSLDEHDLAVLTDLALNTVQLEQAKTALMVCGRFVSFSVPVGKGQNDDGMQDVAVVDTIASDGAVWCDSPEPEIEDFLSQFELRKKVELALRGCKFKPNILELFYRVFYDDMTIADAGFSLGMSRALSHYHYKKILRKLAPLLEEFS